MRHVGVRQFSLMEIHSKELDENKATITAVQETETVTTGFDLYEGATTSMRRCALGGDTCGHSFESAYLILGPNLAVHSEEVTKVFGQLRWLMKETNERG